MPHDPSFQINDWVEVDSEVFPDCIGARGQIISLEWNPDEDFHPQEEGEEADGYWMYRVEFSEPVTNITDGTGYSELWFLEEELITLAKPEVPPTGFAKFINRLETDDAS